jgi:hypothetical protein
MRVCKCILAGLTLLLGAVGLLLSLGVGVGVWMVAGPVSERAARVFDRIEAALDAADRALDQARTSLARAAERLDSAGQEQAKLAEQPQPNNAARRVLARTVQQRLGSELGAAEEKLHAVAEAAVVVNSVLEDVGSLPFLSTSGLDLDRLAEMNHRLGNVGPAAWELSRLLGEPGPDSADAGAQLSRVERSLRRLRGLVAEYEPRVKEVRQRTAELKAKTLAWITPGAAVISLVCLWLALSQVSLLFHAWSWWKHSGRRNPA